MLTARDTTTDKVAGLDAELMIMLSNRLSYKNYLLGFEPCCAESSSSSPILQWGACIGPSTMKSPMRTIHLTPKEYNLLELLPVVAGYLSRSVITCLLVSCRSPEEDTVKAHIKSLRQKIKAVGGPNDLFRRFTVAGYHLKLLS